MLFGWGSESVGNWASCGMNQQGSSFPGGSGARVCVLASACGWEVCWKKGACSQEMCAATSLSHGFELPARTNPQPESSEGGAPCVRLLGEDISRYLAEGPPLMQGFVSFPQPAGAVFQQQVRTLRAHSGPDTDP